MSPGGGGTDLEKGYGDVWPRRPPFHASLVVPMVPFEQPLVHKGPISSNSLFTRPPIEEKMGNFSLYNPKFD